MATSKTSIASPVGLIKSKKRVADHGEVFTARGWSKRCSISSRARPSALIPVSSSRRAAAGISSVPILQRKLAAVELKFGKSDFEKRHYALLALMCTYGIELVGGQHRRMPREHAGSVRRLPESGGDGRTVSRRYPCPVAQSHPRRCHDDARQEMGQPISVVEWGYLGKGKFQRRDFRLDVLTGMSCFREESSLFAHLGKHEIFTPTNASANDGARSVRRAISRLRGKPYERTGELYAARPQSGCADLHRQSLQRRGVHPAGVRQPDAGYAGRGWAADNDGADIWADSSVKFLDPCTKSGVFLREITTRLIKGLEAEIPDLQERVDHILTKQVFGIGITQLTSLLARRSLYCSKHATGEHRVAKSFASDDGNIWFERTEHTWTGDKCKYCGAPRAIFDRESGLREPRLRVHPHRRRPGAPERDFGGDMQFDVIIGNPPYQLASDGGTRDVPLYQKFVDAAISLEPRCALMITPSRWFAGGLGLNDFRDRMLNDKRLRAFVDYARMDRRVSWGRLRGWCPYFLWDGGYEGEL